MNHGEEYSVLKLYLHSLTKYSSCMVGTRPPWLQLPRMDLDEDVEWGGQADYGLAVENESLLDLSDQEGERLAHQDSETVSYGAG
jgi:hypothetical protein